MQAVRYTDERTRTVVADHSGRWTGERRAAGLRRREEAVSLSAGHLQSVWPSSGVWTGGPRRERRERCACASVSSSRKEAQISHQDTGHSGILGDMLHDKWTLTHTADELARHSVFPTRCSQGFALCPGQDAFVCRGRVLFFSIRQASRIVRLAMLLDGPR